MIRAQNAIQQIQTTLDNIIKSSQLKAELATSQSSISIYLYTKDPSYHKQKYMRSSNHGPTLANMVKRKPWKTTNICIEFSESRHNQQGKRLRNRTNPNVLQNMKGTVQPFSIIIYEYQASDLENNDIPIILNAILDFLNDGVYTDPFNNTLKAARVKYVGAIIHNNHSRWNIAQNINGDTNAKPSTKRNYGADYPIEESKQPTTIRINENDIRKMVTECVKKILNNKDKKRLML